MEQKDVCYKSAQNNYIYVRMFKYHHRVSKYEEKIIITSDLLINELSRIKIFDLTCISPYIFSIKQKNSFDDRYITIIGIFRMIKL